MENIFDSSNEIDNDIIEDFSINLPPRKKVIFYNDDYTTMNFVVTILMSIFNKSHVDAVELMKTVHSSGSAVIGTYTYDIAVSRANLTKQIAKENGFPLRVEVE